MSGLKNVRHRRNDALTRVGWDRLETMLAEYYRGQGWQVEHVGTGWGRFDGGIDLKLRKGDEYVLVQSKHWNAKQVTHNAVHELLGIKINESATGAIVVTSGEFTWAAQQAATRQNHVQLIDGDALRKMLGPLLEMSINPAEGAHSQRPAYYNRHVPGRNSSSQRQKGKPSIEPLVRLVVGIIALLILSQCLPRYIQKAIQQPITQPAPAVEPVSAAIPARQSMDRSVVRSMQPEPVRPRPLSAKEEEQALREWQRKNAESMRILEENDRAKAQALEE